MFTAGDKVVHPGHGPGIITGIERRQMLGEEKQYYVIDMLASGGTLMTPVEKAGDIGLRSAIGDASVKRLLKSLTEAPTLLPGDFRERQAAIEERLRPGDVFATAHVIRDLAWYGKTQGLTKRDSQLMQRAEELVAGELALIEGVEIKEALSRLHAAVEMAVAEQATHTYGSPPKAGGAI